MLDAGEFEGGRPEAPRCRALRGERHHRRRSVARRSSLTELLSVSAVLPTYARLDVTFIDGDGSWLDRRRR